MLTNFDTKVGVWDASLLSGQTCPGVQATGLMGCSDDLSPPIPQSKFPFQATAGVQYLFQIGCFPGNQFSPPAPGGQGAFSVEYLPIPDPTPCSYDDGEADFVWRIHNSGSGTCMLTRFGSLGTETRVSGIEVVWGGSLNAANSTLVDGSPARVALWEDPTDDGDPHDCVLLEVVATTIQNHDTDIFNHVPLSTAFHVSGYYYVGALYDNPALTPPNHSVYALDWDSQEVYPAGPNTSAQKFTTWGGVRIGASFDPSDLSMFGPNNVNQVVLWVFQQGVVVNARNNVQLIRPSCAVLPPEVGAAMCSDDSLGIDHTTPCPCGNSGQPGRGCAHSMNSDGAELVAHGRTSDDNVSAPGPEPVTLACVGLPATSFTMFLQHDSPGDGVFHDGVLCAGGTLVRLRGRNAGAGQGQAPGVAVFPNSAFAADASMTLSSRGGVVPGSGAVRYYCAWFRNAASSYCPPATANVSNGWLIGW